MFNDLIAKLSTPDPILLNLTELPRGVDNYHIDVKLSSKFCTDFQKLLALFIYKETGETVSDANIQKMVSEVQDDYLDMMTVLIHRIKTELSPTEVNFLQFAVIRFILASVQSALDSHIKQLRDELFSLRASSSAKSLVVQERIHALGKHYNTIIFNINRRFFALLKSAETKKLQAIRRQYLEPGDKVYMDILFNPMLATPNLDAPNFLVETYLQWNRKGETSEFSSLNSYIEELFEERLPEAEFTPLVEEGKNEGQVEPYDDLKGFAACQPHLGPSPNLKNFLSESFCWLDHPANFELLFSAEKQREFASGAGKSGGLKGWWHLRKQSQYMEKTLKLLAQTLQSRQLLAQLAASDEARQLWKPAMLEHFEPATLCNFLAGTVSFKDFKTRFKAENAFPPAELEALKKRVKTAHSASDTSALVNFLANIALYRQHLKYYRFAHRVFNRISILSDKEKLQLSSQAGTLYQMPMTHEVSNDEIKIAHHTILKADVRGSTTVTDELERQGLNPASYFSLRFFSPINKVLPLYGGQKVFIEGDAIILSLLEYEHTPQHWLAVARACGLAKAMLAVVNANNMYSRQNGLPPLELGIGICYAPYAPRYLYDGEQPIMISSAIGDADRMSSCSWKLRAALKDHPFNVEVLEIASDDQSKGEKGLQHIHFNLDGILLDNDAFAKLANEIELTKLTVKFEGKDVVCHFGEYPDAQGKLRNLVVREAPVGLWRNDTIVAHNSTEKFYEVVTNNQLVAGIQDRMFALKGKGKADVED